MKKIFLALASAMLLLAFTRPGNNYPFDKWDAATLEKANTAKDATYLSDDEKKVIYYINLARLNPNLFSQTYVASFLDSTKAKETSFTRSLKNDLTTRIKPMDVLSPKQDLAEEAKNHAEDSGKAGKKGSFTSDNKSFAVRMQKFKGVYKSTVENCGYGAKDPIAIVMDLLIDEGEASVQNRKNILDKNLKFIGASIQPHKKEKWTCVMDFAN